MQTDNSIKYDENYVSPLHEDCINETLYFKMKQHFPKELTFPERFNLHFNEKCFKDGRSINRKDQSTLFYPQDQEATGRLALVLKRNLPKSFISPKHGEIIDVCGELYNNLQFGYYNEKEDVEHYFHFYPLNSQTKIMIEAYDQDQEWDPNHKDFRLRGRIQYATRHTNSAGVYYDNWGYLYIPKSDQDTFGYPKRPYSKIKEN